MVVFSNVADDMNFPVIHIVQHKFARHIVDKENHIAFWMDCDQRAELIPVAIMPPKQFWNVSSMHDGPLSSTIILKKPN